MARIRNDLRLYILTLALTLYLLMAANRDASVDTHHGGDCSGNRELGSKSVLSYIIVEKCKESEAQAIDQFNIREFRRDNLHDARTISGETLSRGSPVQMTMFCLCIRLCNNECFLLTTHIHWATYIILLSADLCAALSLLAGFPPRHLFH